MVRASKLVSRNSLKVLALWDGVTGAYDNTRQHHGRLRGGPLIARHCTSSVRVVTAGMFNEN